jgi:hypothetical protein
MKPKENPLAEKIIAALWRQFRGYGMHPLEMYPVIPTIIRKICRTSPKPKKRSAKR